MPVLTRRTLLASLPAVAAPPGRDPNLARQLGVTTATLAAQVALRPSPGQIALLDLPRYLRDELDLTVIDLNTNTIKGASRRDLETFRAHAARAGCVITNLKMNHARIALDAEDATARSRAIAAYQASIEDAAVLGCRWVRALPEARRPHWDRYVAGLRELAAAADKRNMGLLVENYGWMENDPDVIPRLIRAIGRGALCQPDTGNWKDDVRYAGLANAFPYAVSCDFKAWDITPAGGHARYDLRRCFDIGWKSGFRGPWCFEHLPEDKTTVFAGLKTLRDLLRTWMREAG